MSRFAAYCLNISGGQKTVPRNFRHLATTILGTKMTGVASPRSAAYLVQSLLFQDFSNGSSRDFAREEPLEGPSHDEAMHPNADCFTAETTCFYF